MKGIPSLTGVTLLLVFVGSLTACKGQVPKEQPFEERSVEEQLNTVKANIRTTKLTLAKQGKYDCCIEEACNRCLFEHGSCPCAADLKAEKPVCPECYAGWQQGKGRIEGIDKSQVKTALVHSHEGTHEHQH